MNRLELIKIVSEKTDTPQTKVGSCLNAILESIVEALNGGEKVTLNKFGTFFTRERPEKKSVNPKTRVPVFLEAKKVVKFRATPDFIEKNNLEDT